jgi:ComF family protein
VVDAWLVPLRLVFVERRCSVCAGFAEDGRLCEGCRADLPWNRIACPVCALPQQGLSYVCASCASTAPPYDLAWSAFRYETPLPSTMAGLKYHAQLRHARLLGLEMAEALARRAAPLPELLLPMPLHPRRLRWRGYNQSLELARAIASRLAIEIDATAVRRTRATADQIGTSAARRRRNVRGAFAAESRLRGRHIALIDDVMTTGASVAELARACRKAGAATIEVWTAARAV